ncbi:hypothetical protein RBK84_00290, partial [Pseudomonas aeruginosa]|uniref:hypothetical protein n=1 Tax=Pseudomonas aeruginosa TaxID=287 RepID=UPI0027D38AEA
GNEGEVWSSVKGTQIVLNNEVLGNILGCKSTGLNILDFKIIEHDRETFHHNFESDSEFDFKN